MWFKLILLFVLSFFASDGKQLNSSIPRISAIQSKTVGENVELECFIENSRNFILIWRKLDGNDMITAGLVTVIADSRFSSTIEDDPSSKEAADTRIYTLKIEDVRESDAGTYQCLKRRTLHSADANAPAEVVLTVQPSSSD